MRGTDVDFAAHTVFFDNLTMSVYQSARYANISQCQVSHKETTHRNLVSGSGRPTLPVHSCSRSCQFVAHPTSVIPYTCSILALGQSFAYSCCCMPSVAQDPPTYIRLRVFSFSSWSHLDNAIRIGGTTTVCVIRNFFNASMNPGPSNLAIMYVGVPCRSGSACCTGIVKTWNGGIAMRFDTYSISWMLVSTFRNLTLYRGADIRSWNSPWETKYECGIIAAFGRPDVPLVLTYAAGVLSGSSTRTQSLSPQLSKLFHD